MNKKYLLLLFLLMVAILLLFIPTTNSNFTTTANSSLSLEFCMEPTYVYYFQAPPDWGADTVYSYMWGTYNGSTVENAAFPGILMDCVDPDLKIYKYTLSSELAYQTYGENVFKNISFSDRQHADDANKKKTVDLKITDDINGKIFVPELYNNPDNTSEVRTVSYLYTTPYIYLWGSNGDNAAWPGVSISSNYVSLDAYYALINKSQYNNLIFSMNGSYKTADLTVPNFQDLTCVFKAYKSSVWKRVFYFGSWHTYSSWIDTEYDDWYSGDYQKFVASSAAGY